MPKRDKKAALGISEPKGVLVTRFSALGDVAMTLPAVYDACIANPQLQFYFLTRHHPAKVFVNHPDNLTVIGIDFDNYKGISGMWRLAAALRKRYDITHYVDLHDVLRTKLLRLFLRINGVTVRHIHKGRRAKRAITRRTNKVLVQLKPTPERYRDAFYKAGVALASDFDSLFGKEKGDPQLFASVTPPRDADEKWIAVAPFAKHKGKIYPAELMENVVAHFAARPGCKVFVLGFGDAEEAIIAKWASRHPNVVNMASAALGIGAELALLSHCDVMISMDSANMHLASLVGLRTVSVWGATHPYTGFLGWRQRTRDVVQLDMTCRPCSVFGDKPCMRGDYHCMAGIPPEMIIRKVEDALQ